MPEGRSYADSFFSGRNQALNEQAVESEQKRLQQESDQKLYNEGLRYDPQTRQFTDIPGSAGALTREQEQQERELLGQKLQYQGQQLKALESAQANWAAGDMLSKYVETQDIDALNQGFRVPVIGRLLKARGIDRFHKVDIQNDRRLLIDAGVPEKALDDPKYLKELNNNLYKYTSGNREHIGSLENLMGEINGDLLLSRDSYNRASDMIEAFNKATLTAAEQAAQDTAAAKNATDERIASGNNETAKYTVDTRTSADKFIAGIDNESAEKIAEGDNATSLSVGEGNDKARITSALIGAESATDVANIRADSADNVANISKDSALGVAGIGAESADNVAKITTESAERRATEAVKSNKFIAQLNSATTLTVSQRKEETLRRQHAIESGDRQAALGLGYSQLAFEKSNAETLNLLAQGHLDVAQGTLIHERIKTHLGKQQQVVDNYFTEENLRIAREAHQQAMNNPDAANDTSTTRMKDNAAAQIEHANAFDILGATGYTDFYNKLSDATPEQYHQLEVIATNVDALQGTEITAKTRENVASLSTVLDLFTRAAKLRPDDTGFFDVWRHEFLEHYYDDVPGTQARAAYGELSNILRHALFGATLPEAEREDFAKGYGKEGQQLGPILDKLISQLTTQQAKLAGYIATSNSFSMRIRLRKSDADAALAMKTMQDMKRRLILGSEPPKVKPKPVEPVKSNSLTAPGIKAEPAAPDDPYESNTLTAPATGKEIFDKHGVGR